MNDKLIVPPGTLESTDSTMSGFLKIPERLNEYKQQETVEGLAKLLSSERYIKEIKMWRGSWGFGYMSNEKAIYVSEKKMPDDSYDYFIFRLGNSPKTEEPLFPNKKETDQYRFIHEVSHAYQDYLIDKEGKYRWYERALSGESVSPLSTLLAFCYKKRLENPGKGLSTWGQVRDYDKDRHLDEQGYNETLTRAFEDANELITMYLWHSDYLNAFLNYVSLQNPNYGKESLNRDGYVQLSQGESILLQAVIYDYINDMKKDIENRRIHT